MLYWLFAVALAAFPGKVVRDGQNFMEIRKPGFVGRIPQLGLGTYKLKGEKCYNGVLKALELGYKHIDTADNYGNQKEIGKALKDSKVPREKIFITSKISFNDHGTERTRQAIDRILSELDLDYIDLLLVHFPGVMYDEEAGRDIGGVLDVGEGYVMADLEASLKLRIETWRVLEAALEKRQTRFIGVSNYEVSHLKELLRYARIPPSVNQVELHPFLPKMKLQEFCKENKIIIEVYGSIRQNGKKKFLRDGIISEMAAVHEKSEAQVALKWAVQQDLVVLPKSSKAARIKENMDIFDWELRTSDQAVILFFDCDTKLSKSDKVSASCTRTPCGKSCFPGTHYWDPSLVPASNRKSTIDRLSKEVDDLLESKEELLESEEEISGEESAIHDEGKGTSGTESSMHDEL